MQRKDIGLHASTETTTSRTDTCAIDAVPAAGPIHRAIDRVTAVQLTVQQLRRRVVEQHGLAGEFDRLEETLQDLGSLLISLRDTRD